VQMAVVPTVLAQNATPTASTIAPAPTASTPPATDANAASADQEKPITFWSSLTGVFKNLPYRPPTEQDKAVVAARKGNYDEAIATLDRLHRKYKNDQSVTRDYIAVLSWAGHDQEAVDMYSELEGQQPNYELSAIGHSYHDLGQNDKALDIYRLGLIHYPDNVTFAEGELRCMVDLGDLDNALVKADADLAKHGERPPIMAIKKEILQLMVKRDDQKAIALARTQHYPEALAILSGLYAQHGDDPAIASDYLAVLGWAGGNDQQVVKLYETLPAADQPDYILKVVGHAYRQLKQSDQALPIYQQGQQKYPDDVAFPEGVIRCLADEGKYDEALTAADADLSTHGLRPEIVDAKKNILRLQKDAKHHVKNKHHSA